MRRIILLLTVAAMLATMLALTGQSLAKNTQPKQESYTHMVELRQYFAKPLIPGQDGGSWFRGSVTDIEDDQDPGLPGQLDTSITYTGGAPGPGVKNTITGGEWMLCSNGFQSPPLDTSVTPPKPIPPECKPDTTYSQITLKGTWSSGIAKWDKSAGFATSCLPRPVYAGKAEVKGSLTVTGGTVNGVPVNGGSGKFEGTLDHRPLALSVDQYPCGDPRRAPIVEGTMKLKF